ncbi:MAG TPA: lipopolysaccharide heptosyltransferase II [Candidatus Kryptonia bacterium]|nr:lipopolysaccharide heptosyltransferase II [Candidatus Kryptonia bacterium]
MTRDIERHRFINGEPRTALIVKLSSIGDVVHALPVATALRRRYPTIRISWAVEDWVAPLVIGHPAVERVVVFPRMRWSAVRSGWLRSFMRATRELQNESYDVSIDLQGLLKSAVVALLSRARLRIGAAEPREGAGLVSAAVSDRLARVHVVEDYLRCATFLGAAAQPIAFDLPVHIEAQTSIERILHELQIPAHRPLIVINPSSSVTWRTWPIEPWAQVARELTEAGTVVLIGGREQVARHAEVARRADRPIHDLTGRTTLAELVALLDRCTLHVAPDTGSAHIAAALGRPVVSLYGPTAPWRKGPYGCDELVVHHEAACGVGCPRWCVRGRQCLRKVAPEELIARAATALVVASNTERSKSSSCS